MNNLEHLAAEQSGQRRLPAETGGLAETIAAERSVYDPASNTLQSARDLRPSGEKRYLPARQIIMPRCDAQCALPHGV